MFRILALLQLTRAALAFTAIADAWAVLLLRPPSASPPEMMMLIYRMLITGVASFCLYAFGMALNDLVDARRDRIFAPRRPIPSGRIRPRSALIVSLALLMVALTAAVVLLPLQFTQRDVLRLSDLVPYSFILTLATAALIVFYDATAKYLGGMGLVTLGAIRALHCLIGHPKTPLLFLSMILLTHVIVISTIAYRLEGKRPRLKAVNYVTIVLGLLIGNGGAMWYMWLRGNALVSENMPMLIGPAVAAVVYAVWAVGILLVPTINPRQKGERIMLLGLFWLFVYDASILLSNGQILASVAITLLLFCAIVSFFSIRFFSRMLSQPRLDYRPERPGA
ncbi:MAG: UbiA family prenyltransferase [Phycisphaerales bacterium]|nr:UbiA family prenyltransferase [Phycisphaerales bacterium]